MARKIKIESADADRFGIRISYADGVSGWIVGVDGDYLLFSTEAAANRVLKKMMQDDRYSWNCEAEVVAFDG